MRPELETESYTPQFRYKVTLTDTDMGAPLVGPGTNVDFYQYDYQGVNHEGDLAISDNTANNPLQLIAPAGSLLAQIMDDSPPSHPVRVEVQRYDGQEFRTVWKGTATGYSIINGIERRLNLEPVTLATTKGGLRMTWSRQCPYVLYDHYTCSVPPENFVMEANSMDVIDRSVIRSPIFASRPTGYYDDGVLVWERTYTEKLEVREPVNAPVTFKDTRTILRHYGDTVQMAGGTESITSSGRFQVLPGCDRSREMCHERFGNLRNNGSVFIDGESPFSGNPVF